MSRSRCVEDEELLAAILKATPHATHLYISDARPRVNAMANTAKGIQSMYAVN